MAIKDLFTKAKPERSPSEAPVQPQILYLSSGIAAAIVQWNSHIQAEKAMQHPIVYRALDMIAKSVQQVPWEVQDDPNATATERNNAQGKKRRLQELLNCPNPNMTPANLRYWMALNYACYGRVPLNITFRATQQDEANSIYPLEARYVYSKLNDRGYATSYEYGQLENKAEYPSQMTWTRGSRKGFVEEIWKPSLRGYQHKDEINSPLCVSGLPAQVVTSLLHRTIQTAEGHPNVRYLVTCNKTLTEAQKKALKQHLNEDHGPEGPDAGKVPILQNAGDIQIHTLDNDLSDIHSKMPSDDMARLIYGAFDIPIALAGIGAADAAKFAGNYSESNARFWQGTIVPGYVSPLFQGLTRMLCPVGLCIKPNFEHVPAMVGARIQSMKEASAITFLTDNEKRAMFELQPQDGGDIITEPQNAPTPND